MKLVDGKPQSAFVLYINGDERQGQERMGKEVGTMLETDIPKFMVELGKTVEVSGKNFGQWNRENPEMLEKIAEKWL